MNILLVEDDQDSRIQMANFLRELDHSVVECRDGYEALEAFTRDFHMVLSDIKMPRISGIELLRKISSLPGGQEVATVLFTGYGDMESAIEALRAGAYDYLLKPINVKELAAVAERVAKHQSLCRQNRIFSEKTDNQVKTATKDSQLELYRLKEACTRTVGLDQASIFSDKMRDVFGQAYKFHTDRSIPVLIQGETGTGKEVVARYIHFGNMQCMLPFVDINCAALNPGIFESELFGYEAGSFTGGLPKGQKGKLDIAKGGTVFLDEIAELPTDLQAKLLRVIQEKEFYRVGGLRKIKTDIRIICATNVDLFTRMEQGAFRKDLYYRLKVGHLVIPPLRERTEEILPLARMFLNKFACKRGKRFSGICDSAAQIMLTYDWPGNVRELRNAMEWVAFMHDGVEVKPSHLGVLKQAITKSIFPDNSPSPVLDPEHFSLPSEGLDIEGFFSKIVLQALEMHNRNKTKAARYLGISWRSLDCRLARLRKQQNMK